MKYSTWLTVPSSSTGVCRHAVQQMALQPCERCMWRRRAAAPPPPSAQALFSSPGWWGASAAHRAEEAADEQSRPAAPLQESTQSRRDHEEQRRIEEDAFTCRRLSEEAGWRGAGGDLWPLRILFWRILWDGRTVRMRTNMVRWTERFQTKSNLSGQINSLSNQAGQLISEIKNKIEATKR